MGKIFLAIVIMLLMTISFYTGSKWREKTLGTSQKVQLKVPLEIQISPNKKGLIPDDTVLYLYRKLPEITTYYIFINLKEIDVVKEFKSENFNLIVPVDAFPVIDIQTK